MSDKREFVKAKTIKDIKFFDCTEQKYHTLPEGTICEVSPIPFRSYSLSKGLSRKYVIFNDEYEIID